jgi:hypothetical protein
MLEGENGLLMPALKVFSESIKYLRGHLENYLHRKQVICGLQASDVDWVLTVPAIWTDPAKQFMREAANLVCILTYYVVALLNHSQLMYICIVWCRW